MNKELRQCIGRLHTIYPSKLNPENENHITVLLAQHGFMTRDEAKKLHEEYHNRTMIASHR